MLLGVRQEDIDFCLTMSDSMVANKNDLALLIGLGMLDLRTYTSHAYKDKLEMMYDL